MSCSPTLIIQSTFVIVSDLIFLRRFTSDKIPYILR